MDGSSPAPVRAAADGQYRIFISHKQEDEAAALAVRDAIGQFSGSLRFFISGESIAEGQNWRGRLREELQTSNLLLLLFTEPTRNWGWCLYEVGLFESLEQDQKDEPVVCIFNPDGDPPSPLAKTPRRRSVTEQDGPVSSASDHDHRDHGLGEPDQRKRD